MKIIDKILHHFFFEILVLLFLGLGVVVCLFPNFFPGIQVGANYAIQIMLFYLFLALLFLILKQRRLMFISFGCCAILCVFLKHSLNIEEHEAKSQLPSSISPPDTTTTIKIAHFNLTDAGEDIGMTLQNMLETNGDIISIQEVTLDWIDTLESFFKPAYPHYIIIPDLGMFGNAIFSKHDFIALDTFYFQEIPNLAGALYLEETNEKVAFISTHTYPVFNSTDAKRLNAHLDTIQNYIQKIEEPLLVFGNFNVVPWSAEIRDFRNATNLLDSRQGFMPIYPDGSLTFFDVPFNHIFYSDQLKCLTFENLSNEDWLYLGIQGKYQFKPIEENVEKTTQ